MLVFDKAFVNGKIHTMDNANTQAEAMLVTTTDVQKEAPIVAERAEELDVILVERDQLLEKNGLLHLMERIRG